MKAIVSLLMRLGIAALVLLPVPLRAQIKDRQKVVNHSDKPWKVTFTKEGRQEFAGRAEKDLPSLEIMDGNEKKQVGIIKGKTSVVTLEAKHTYVFRYHLPDAYLKGTQKQKENFNLLVMGLCFKDSKNKDVVFFETYDTGMKIAGFSFPDDAVPDGFEVSGDDEAFPTTILITTATAP
jgi:hypothetical protein